MLDKEIIVKWTPFALGCLDEIYEYILFREKSPTPGSRLIASIFDRIDQLKDFSESGPLEPILKSTGRERRYLTLSSYKIIYQYYPKEQLVVITDVFHTSQYPGKVTRNNPD